MIQRNPFTTDGFHWPLTSRSFCSYEVLSGANSAESEQ